MRAKALVDGKPTTSLLQNSEPRICLHQANQAQDRIRSHEAVGVERDRKFVIPAPSVTEIANIAGLISGIDGAPPVGRADAIFPSRGQLAETNLFRLRNRAIIRVAQHI